MTPMNRQHGLSLLGFMGILVMVLFFTYIGIKLVPIYLNHMSVVSEMKAVAGEPGVANQPAQTTRRQLMTRFDISFVDHVKPENVRIERSDGVNLVVKYDVETHLIGNIDAVVRFHRVERLRD
jgi:hypothetical protein